MKRQDFFIGLFLLKLLDVITTIINIQTVDMIETNPMIRPIISLFGIGGLITISLIGSGVMAVALERVYRVKSMRVYCWLPFVFWGIMPVINFISLGYAL